MEQADISLGSELNPIPDSFSSVRRKESTLNNGRLNRDVKKEWTSARCNRLLRSLTSRIAILRKNRQISSNYITPQSKKRKSVSDLNNDASCEELDNVNANWIGQKRVKRTYSGKTGTNGSGQHITSTGPYVRVSSNGRRPSVPGEFMFLTPLLVRAWGEPASPYRAIPYKGMTLGHHQQKSTDSIIDEPARTRPLGTSKAQTLGSQAFSKIRNTMSAERFNTYEGIYNGLEALLRATCPTIPSNSKKGPKSLLSMCLRTVPKYITMEEKLLANEIGSRSAIEERDISTEIYDDLELLGSSGRGWRHLQSVVRAHGVQIICNAIVEGLLEHSFCEILVDLCIYSDYHDEADLILSSLLSICKFPAPRSSESLFSESRAHQPLLKIWNFAEKSGRTEYLYRQLSILFQNGNLPLPWVATRAFTPIWTGLMHELWLGRARVDATTLMNTILPRLVEYVSSSDSLLDADLFEICRRTLLSVLTVISSIILLSRDAVESTLKQESKHTTTISENYSMLLRDCVRTIKRGAKEVDLQCTILLLACLVTEPNANDTSDFITNSLYRLYAEEIVDPGTGRLSQPFQRTLFAHNEAVKFISSVARCCGKGASTSGFEYLQHVHGKLKQVNTGRGLKARTVLRGIVVDSAFAFAQVTPGQKYLDYADSLDDELHAESSRRPDSANSEAHHESRDFRWEEGISSWVPVTPASNTSKSKSIPTSSERDELELESPSVARAQRPVRLDPEPKKRYDSAGPDQSAEPEIQLPSRIEDETRRGKAASLEVWHYDSSDDELNSSHESFQDTHVLKIVRNTVASRRSKLVKAKRQKQRPTINYEQSSYSEDELCI
ncbi:hypothetical protein SBOR_2009 [Sclerotinia borealis F-4128]|uniref:Uncharacterized protein n=1 Tax=Sclerotinia borealis (strain F-4128) TaxID=1432307 RepID=W9CNI0_SCLBF|nr:hypothetical protein SBOR_2009 [Sclerotinia borealis F-4128]